MARGYRDELAALRARKEALEGEVAELREREEELSEKEKELVEAQAHIARLEAKVDELEDERPGGQAERLKREEAEAERRQRAIALAFVALVVLGAVGGFVFVRASSPAPTSTFPPVERVGLPACMVESTPSGVAVYGGLEAFVANGGDATAVGLEERHLLGRTPVALARMIGYEVELEKPGFRPMTLRVPELDPEDLDGSCTLRTTLVKESL